MVKFKGWFSCIVINFFYDELCKCKWVSYFIFFDVFWCMDDGEIDWDIEFDYFSFDEILFIVEFYECLCLVIKDLFEVFCIIIILWEIDGLVYEEIVEIIGVFFGMVKFCIVWVWVKL